MSRRTLLAWFALAGTLPSFGAGMLAGEGLLSGLAGPMGASSASLWMIVAAGAAALLLVVSAPLAAGLLGRASFHHGDPSGRLPMMLGFGVAAGLLLLNLAAFVLG